MYPVQDTVSRATQEHLESQWDTSGQLADKFMEGMKQVVDLHLNLARLTLDQANFATRQLMTSSDANDFITLAESQRESDARRTMDYAYYLTSIASSTLLELARVVGSVVADADSKVMTITEDIGKNAPGMSVAIGLLKALIDGITILYDELTRIAQSSMRPLNGKS